MNNTWRTLRPTEQHFARGATCPATSASVERLFSIVGICFSDKRKSSQASTLADLVFTKINVPSEPGSGDFWGSDRLVVARSSHVSW